MKAVLYRQFRGPLALEEVPDPEPPKDGVVIEVQATGLCRSDWHGWMGHDPDIRLPHVPGHELAGTVAVAGPEVRRFKPGDRVTVPFMMGCGECDQCRQGQQQVCDRYYQPGFTGWGSFAPYVALPHADINLVALPAEVTPKTAAILGCRFATAYRALVVQGRLAPGEWVAVHGSGGVGLSAVMIAAALGARVVAVDIAPDKLALARELGAEVAINAKQVRDVGAAVRDATQGGAQVSMDALGSTATCLNSLSSLRKRGRHVQVGLMLGEHATPAVPMAPVIAYELEILGSHGMQAHQYPAMLDLITSGRLRPERLLGRTISLADAVDELPKMGSFGGGVGVTVIDRF
ncbi:MAG: zinc-dependent alcohol dehydrogenase family protein [Gemmatimonadales bacterium]